MSRATWSSRFSGFVALPPSRLIASLSTALFFMPRMRGGFRSRSSAGAFRIKSGIQHFPPPRSLPLPQAGLICKGTTNSRKRCATAAPGHTDTLSGGQFSHRCRESDPAAHARGVRAAAFTAMPILPLLADHGAAVGFLMTPGQGAPLCCAKLR
jgi:hypothetical protein